jgi:hypothetical protein
LTHIFRFQFRIIPVEVLRIGVERDGFHNSPDRESQSPDARLPVHLSWIPRHNLSHKKSLRQGKKQMFDNIAHGVSRGTRAIPIQALDDGDRSLLRPLPQLTASAKRGGSLFR